NNLEVNVPINDSRQELSVNSILYGPPGTGKTYNTVLYAIAICDNESIDALANLPYEQVLERYNSLKNDGRIAFTTFHQSYGYEEFIEGIKPVINEQDEGLSSDIKYEHVSGVFKKFCETAKGIKIQTSSLKIRQNPTVWNVILEGTGQTKLKIDCFNNNFIKIGWSNVDEMVTDESKNLNSTEKRILLNFQDEMQIGDIVFIQRTNTSIDGIGIITGPYEFIKSGEKYPRRRNVEWIATNINEDVYSINKNTRLNRLSVYPLRNMNIKDVIGLIDKYKINHDIKIEENRKPYVFIIDEINRGNISKIFGELITLIEQTKRLGEPEATTAILPYTGGEFGVPNNVYILGTMNTADRSIALLDTALRRRFKFIEMMPDADVLRNLGINTIEGIDIPLMLETINERIEYLFDREHTIGHAYFTPLAKDPSISNLEGIFLNAIIPLLQEYFYEDYSKIQLILGDNAKTEPSFKFILDKKMRNVFKGNPDIDLPEMKYSIQRDAFYKPESYIQIY
ncbi:AAA family ATPase, partial [Neobacillus citreus]